MPEGEGAETPHKVWSPGALSWQDLGLGWGEVGERRSLEGTWPRCPLRPLRVTLPPWPRAPFPLVTPLKGPEGEARGSRTAPEDIYLLYSCVLSVHVVSSTF